MAVRLAAALIAVFACLSCGESGDRAVELLVVDYNLLHGIGNEDPAAQPYDRFPERIRLVADALAELRPDVVFLQEVVREGGEDYGDVRAMLLAALGAEYTAVFGDITGAPIDTGALGQMTLTRLPVLSAENHHIAGVRSVHRVTVDTDIGAIDLYNTHLEGTGAVFDVGRETPVDEIEDLLMFIEETRSGVAVIVGGDFNAEPDDPSIGRVLAAGFLDLLDAGGDATCEQAGDPGCTSSTRPLADNATNLAERRIDYIFASAANASAVDVLRAELFLDRPVAVEDGRLLWPSDHIGVVAEIEVSVRP